MLRWRFFGPHEKQRVVVFVFLKLFLQFAGVPLMFVSIAVLGTLRLSISRHAMLASPDVSFFSPDNFNNLVRPMLPNIQGAEEMSWTARALAWGVIAAHFVLSLVGVIFLGNWSSITALGLLIWTFPTLQIPSLLFVQTIFGFSKPVAGTGIVFASVIALFVVYSIASVAAVLNRFWGPTIPAATVLIFDALVVLYQAAWYSVAFAANNQTSPANDAASNRFVSQDEEDVQNLSVTEEIVHQTE
jgi:hypothetical protein